MNISNPDCIRTYLDLSTAHITQKDADKLTDDSRSRTTGLPLRCCEHEYGFTIFTCPDDVEVQIKAVKGRGFSQALCDLYEHVVVNMPHVGIINFDADAPQCDTLPTFDW